MAAGLSPSGDLSHQAPKGFVAPGRSVVSGRGGGPRCGLPGLEDGLEHPAHYAGTDRGSSAADDSLCDCLPVFSAKPFRAPDYRLRRCAETLGKGPISGRGVEGTFGNPGGDCYWRGGDRDDVRSEVVWLFLFHL